MLTTIIATFVLLILILCVVFMHFGIKFIRNRHYALVPNEDNSSNDVYIQFL